MAVTRIEIRRRGPYASGASFGVAGAYERIDGIIHFAVDPDHDENRAIVDLDRAPRDDAGRVRFSADICLLVPVEPERGNRRLLLELPNRGRKLSPRQFNSALSDPAASPEIDPGDGFLFRHGFSVVWIGWQCDVYRDGILMGLEAPQALENGAPIRGQTIIRFQPNVAHRTHLLADRVHQPYPTADVDDPDAVMTVREHASGECAVIPRERWRFARETDQGVAPDREHVYLESGFEPGKIYELVYTTDRSPVVGAGLLAVRDSASYLRYSTAPDNPLAGAIDRAYGFGISQTGRLLRHFIYLGLNVDEEGRLVFDGIMPHVAGARRGEFNHRFAQPSVQLTPGFGHLFPFADEELPAPDGGPPDGMLKRLRQRGSVPRIFYVNSSAEYWRGDSALLHIDPSGRRDLDPAPEARIYHFAGTQHGPGSLPLAYENPNEGSRGRYGFNAVDYTPLLRAALRNLDAWVSEGIEPPPSAHPRLDDGTAVSYETALAAFAELPGIHLPDPARLPRIRRVDLGPDAARGIGRFPAVEGEPYPAFVSAVDHDRNELAGIRLPDLTVPVGTYTGWNPRDPATGAPEQILSMQGATHWFRRDEAARRAAGDPRPSLAERYPSRDDYRQRVLAEARRLARERYILEEDIEIVVDNALARYDAALEGASRSRAGGG